MKKILKLTSTFIILALLATTGIIYYHYQSQHPSTDDAYVQAHIVNIAPQVTGTVKQVLIDNHKKVKKDQRLFTIDPRPFQLAVNKAKANMNNTLQNIKTADANIKTAEAALAQAQAEQTNTQKNTARILTLVQQKLASPSEGDKATSELAVANATINSAKSELTAAQATRGKTGDDNATLQAAKADLDQAQLNLQYTQVYAPTTGYIANFSLRRGDQLTAYQTQFAIVDNQHWWISANFKETALQYIQPGQTAHIILDMYPHYHYTGIVDSISVGSGSSFSLLPAENASGNWVKVTQRFPVKILLSSSDQAPLRLGASATVTIDTTPRATPISSNES